MSGYPPTAEQVEALARFRYCADTGYPNSPERFDNSFYQATWIKTTRNLIESAAFQDILTSATKENHA